jgi:hypothetical protein
MQRFTAIVFFLLPSCVYSPYNSCMKKITVHIADQQYSRVKLLAQTLGIKQAELLRHCLEEGLARREEEHREHARRTGRGTG